MNSRGLPAPALRRATAATLAAGGYIHAQLYVDGYRFIHVIGPLFLLQASASLALAALLMTGTPPLLLRAGAAGVALGALGGFTASRTVGVFGFTERGLQPAPQAVLSLLAETGTLLLLATWQTAVAVAARQEVSPMRPEPRPEPRPGSAWPSPHLRDLRDTVRVLLGLHDDTAVVIRQLGRDGPGPGPGCPPLETVVEVLPMDGGETHRWTLHRPADQITEHDLRTALLRRRP
ncbi:hypothetical protein ACFWPQ_09740 [Streptomyces sp. NPDC058464]|uniref:hypothetical protein n=1 Tax=Streptomyces sp. NPDC058464 TaxID=3346511 RepID=UPI003662E7B8